jgi:hypothetical protein
MPIGVNLSPNAYPTGTLPHPSFPSPLFSSGIFPPYEYIGGGVGSVVIPFNFAQTYYVSCLKTP